jgi:hypothetical protein
MTYFLAVLAAALIQAAPGGVHTLAVNPMSNVQEPRQVVARTAAEWAALWQAHAGGNTLAPAVDFNTHSVVAVFLGTRPSPGYFVTIVGTRVDGAVLVVQWSERRPVRGDVSSAAVLTSPAVLASVPKPAGEIRFEKVDK